LRESGSISFREQTRLHIRHRLPEHFDVVERARQHQRALNGQQRIRGAPPRHGCAEAGAPQRERQRIVPAAEIILHLSSKNIPRCPERNHADYGRLGLAFQHTNFVRDVAEDYRLDRIYLPQEDRERFGVAEADFGRASASPELRALVEHEVARARRLFAAAGPAVAAAPAAVRPGIRLACAVYESVLDRVEAARYDVLGRRMGVGIWRLPLLAFGALRP